MRNLNYCQVIAYNKISHSGHFFCKLSANVKENLSQLVQRKIKELGLSKAQLAANAKLSRAYITDIANGTASTQSGQYRPSPEVIAKLANALKIPESEILGAIGHNIETQNSENSVEVTSDLRISLQGGKNLTKKQQKEILDAAALIARGMLASSEEEKKKEKLE